MTLKSEFVFQAPASAQCDLLVEGWRCASAAMENVPNPTAMHGQNRSRALPAWQSKTNGKTPAFEPGPAVGSSSTKERT